MGDDESKSYEVPARLADRLEQMSPILKAHIIDREDLAPSNVDPEGDEANAFIAAGAIEPPFDPETLCLLFKHSNSLRQNVEAYQTNIESFGHRFEPVIDLTSEDADKQISDAIFLERVHAGKIDADEVQEKDLPTDDEVKARRKLIEVQMRLELSKLKNFFDFCCVDMSFVELRQRRRQDYEVLGNAWWEIIRNKKGEIAQFNYVPGFTVRLTPLDPKPTTVTRKMRISDIGFVDQEVSRRFRRYVQIFHEKAIFFKEFGDPRTISKKTGEVFKDAEAIRLVDDQDGPATEMIHFDLFSPESSYGMPRWFGNFLSVVGSRQSEEVNFFYFDNKAVPPLVLLVSGGRISGNTVQRIEDHINNRVKGRRNFHSVMIIEAEPASAGAKGTDATGRVKLDLQPLTKAQQNDALFQKYDERNIDKVGMSFRLPRMLRGDIRDFNRATADAALAFAEMQVFQPERQSFDFFINRRLLADEMGIRFWRFVSNAPITRDPAVMAKIVKDFVNANVFTAEDARPLAADVFNREFKTPGDWAKLPIPLQLAGIVFDDKGKLVPENKADLDVGDLEEGGGLKLPAQGGHHFGGPFSNVPGAKKPRFRRTIFEKALYDMSLRESAEYLVRLHAALKRAEEDEVEEEFKKAKADVAKLKALADDNAG